MRQSTNHRGNDAWTRALLLWLFTVVLSAHGWCGELTGRFFFTGELPANIDGVKVDPASKGIADVLVYLRPANDAYRERKRAPGEVSLTLDRHGFNKRLVGLTVGQSLKIKQRGDVAHCPVLLRPDRVESPSLDVKRERTYEFDRAYRFPIPIMCNLHRGEGAYAFVHANRHFAITNRRGEFLLAELPAGANEIQFWHASTGPLRARADWRRGRLSLNMTKESNVDLGEIGVSSGVFDGTKGER